MPMRIRKQDMCSSCLKFRYRMDDGSLSASVEEFLASPGYAGPMGPVMINEMIALALKENGGGCPNCQNLVKRATE